MWQTRVGLLLVIVSFFFIIPGVSLPMLHVQAVGDIDSALSQFDLPVLDQSRSILETVKELYLGHNFLVSFLIAFFSIAVPFLKGILLIAASFVKNQELKLTIYRFVKFVGRWSMADVFVVAIFLTYLSTRASPTVSHHKLELMGFAMDVKASIVLSSQLGHGFYWFLSHCLLAMVATCFFPSSKST